MQSASAESASAPASLAWQEAYLRFRRPEQEVQRFRRQLTRVGAARWQQDSRIVDVFFGRGNSLRALHSLGFDHLEGLDLSPCPSRYRGPGRLLVGSCRHLPLPDHSRDVLIAQGGLHHLDCLDDVEHALAEAARVLRREGRFVMIEPWGTPVRTMALRLSRLSVCRALSGRVDAFATMAETQRESYMQWLNNRETIQGLLHKFFRTEFVCVRWGTISFAGRTS